MLYDVATPLTYAELLEMVSISIYAPLGEYWQSMSQYMKQSSATIEDTCIDAILYRSGVNGTVILIGDRYIQNYGYKGTAIFRTIKEKGLNAWLDNLRGYVLAMIDANDKLAVMGHDMATDRLMNDFLRGQAETYAELIDAKDLPDVEVVKVDSVTFVNSAGVHTVKAQGCKVGNIIVHRDATDSDSRCANPVLSAKNWVVSHESGYSIMRNGMKLNKKEALLYAHIFNRYMGKLMNDHQGQELNSPMAMHVAQIALRKFYELND